MTDQIKSHYWLPQALHELRLALNEKICDETLRKIKVSEPVDCMYGFDENHKHTCFKFLGSNIWLASTGNYYHKVGVTWVCLSEVRYNCTSKDEETIVHLPGGEYFIPTLEQLLENFTPFKNISEQTVIYNLEELLNEYDAWEGVYDYDIALVKQQAEMVVDQLAIIDASGCTQDISVRY